MNKKSLGIKLRLPLHQVDPTQLAELKPKPAHGPATGCLLCGAELTYFETRSARRCELCGQEAMADATCLAGHYVCDTCHGASALDLIENVCRHAEGRDPLALAAKLMTSPSVHMHGPEHHYLVPAVLVATFCQASGRVAEKEKLLAEARRRAQAVLGGVCGFWGACGAGIGVGIFMSLVTGTTPVSEKTWAQANAATARALARIAEKGGPRCCKRDTYLALQEAVAVTREVLGVELESREIVCEFMHRNRECLHTRCAFFPRRAKTDAR
jgi:hypothetical protein